MEMIVDNSEAIRIFTDLIFCIIPGMLIGFIIAKISIFEFDDRR